MSIVKNKFFVFWFITLIFSVITTICFGLLVFFSPWYLKNINFAGEVIPIETNEVVKEKLYSEYYFSFPKLYHFYSYLSNYMDYIPYIEKKLKEKNMPDDLKYLAIAESFLKVDANSHKWAAWVWQFMPDTAKRYGLQVDEIVDERYDFEKSTDAALLYLGELYAQFWDWILVIAAYNRWENGLKNDLKEQKVDNFYDLETNTETSEYLYRILDIKYKILNLKKIKNKVNF